MVHLKAAKVSQAQVAKDFDNAAANYEAKVNASLSFAGRDHSFYIDIKREHILRLASEQFGDTRTIDALDLGCGIGTFHLGLKSKFRELHGIDVSAQSIQVAAESHPFVHYSTFDGDRLPYRDGQFSLPGSTT